MGFAPPTGVFMGIIYMDFYKSYFEIVYIFFYSGWGACPSPSRRRGLGVAQPPPTDRDDRRTTRDGRTDPAGPPGTDGRTRKALKNLFFLLLIFFLYFECRVVLQVRWINFEFGPQDHHKKSRNCDRGGKKNDAKSMHFEGPVLYLIGRHFREEGMYINKEY